MALLNYKEALMEEYIKNYNNTPITYSKLHSLNTFTIDKRLHIIPDDPTFAMYQPEIDELKYEFTMNDAQIRRYEQNPKLLSFDLYGTTELWWMILEANDIYSSSEMTMNPVVVFDSGILRILEAVQNLERKTINANLEAVRKEITKNVIPAPK